MKKSKKWLSILLCAAFLIGLLPTVALADTAPSNEDGSNGAPQAPGNNQFWVDYDSWHNEDDNTDAAHVKVNGTAVSSFAQQPFVKNSSEQYDEIFFTLVPPAERENQDPIVEIEILGEQSTILRSDFDNENKITITNNTFSFTPTSDSGFIVRVWWSAFDALRCGDNQYIVRTWCANGAGVSFSKELVNQALLGEDAKYVFATSSNSLTATFTAEEDFTIRHIEIIRRANDNETRLEYFENAPQETPDAPLLSSLEKNEAGQYIYTFDDIVAGEEIELRVDGDSNNDNPNEDGNNPSIELRGSTSVKEGTFQYANGTARVMFVRDNNPPEGAYDGNVSQIELSDDVTAVKIILTAQEGYRGELSTGGNIPPVPQADVKDNVYTYTFARDTIVGNKNFVAFSIEFVSTGGSGEGEGEGDSNVDFTAVIWDGEQVEVQSTHGTISVSSVEIGSMTYPYAGEGKFTGAAEELISWYGYNKTSPREEAGVRIGDAAFANEGTKVYINFVFRPDYGYQVTGIGTNENATSLVKPLTDAGFAAAETISTFKFEVFKHNNPHFTVVFTKTDDIIASSTAKVSGGSILNGSNATNSGNLQLTVADMDAQSQGAFANELQAGETATYLNLQLDQIVSKGVAGENWETPITQFDDPIVLALDVDAQSGDEYRVLRKHGDTIDSIEATAQSDGMVTFQTNQFSDYVLVKKAAQTPTTPTTPSTPGSSTGGSSGGGSSNSTSTTTNPDGSTTTTTTDKATGTVTETTKNTDGSTTVVETKKDGTVTETVKTTDGTTGTVVTDKAGNVTEVKASISTTAAKEAGKTGGAVTLPVEVPSVKTTSDAPAVEITMPVSAGSVKVEVPVEKVTPGTVAVLVKADGTEEIVKATTMGKDGVLLPLAGSATVKIVDNSKDFADTASVKSWAGDAVSYVTAREIFNGTGTTTPVFSPEANMTRGMLMTVLARYKGADTTGGATWYEKGMDWAKANGVSDGSNPNGNITREQLVVMLHRYANSPVSNYAPDFPDVDNVSDYAADAMRWAVETGLINGMNGNMNPQGNATRAQVATIMMRFCENGVN